MPRIGTKVAAHIVILSTELLGIGCLTTADK
jgi:hypothetical protein